MNICVYCEKKCQKRFTRFPTKYGTRIYCDNCYYIHEERRSDTRRKVILNKKLSRVLTVQRQEKMRQELLSMIELKVDSGLSEHLQPFQSSLQSVQK